MLSCKCPLLQLAIIQHIYPILEFDQAIFCEMIIHILITYTLLLYPFLKMMVPVIMLPYMQYLLIQVYPI